MQRSLSSGTLRFVSGVLGVLSVTARASAQDCVSWVQVASGGPVGRGGYAMAYDAAHGVVVMFGGGCSDSGAVFGDTWTWDGTSWTQRASTGPSPRVSSAMAYDSARANVILFGGFDGNTFYGDTWEWDGQAWSMKSTTGPAVRDGTAMAYDGTRARVALFSGNNSPADTWEWNGSLWTQRQVSGPWARFGSAMVFDDFRQESVVFGGSPFPPGPSLLGDTWGWNGTAWIQRAAGGPSARTSFGMAYDGARRAVILFGGSTDSTAVADTWQWDGVTWTQLSTTGPVRHGHAIAYDSTRDRLVLFGGGGGTTNCNSDTWELVTNYPPTISQQPASRTIDLGEQVVLSVVASAPHPITYQWKKGGVNVLNGGRTGGAKTATLTINNSEPSDDGDYTVVLSGQVLCTATSDTATVLVICPSDFNRDGFVDPLDYNAYINAFESADMSADFNGDGWVDPLDYNAYINAFEAGC